MESISKQIKDFENISDNLKEKGIFKSQKLFKCILGLNDLETEIFAYLLNHENVSTRELTQFFEMDRSSIQRGLQTISDMHLINRQSMSLKKYSELKKLEKSKKRGYLYVYNAQSVDKIQNQLRELLKKWYKSMLSYVEDLDSLIECYEYGGELCS